ncbi:hypothetical protein DB346_20170 [Verrucomicrobia bacterium LW23]|nr:hypothetical protein DB346_20170 [Verrucomicrobia bacterium LW23]
MNLQDFMSSAQDAGATVPPPGLSLPLQALWYTSRDWDRAHTLAQEATSTEGDWVHAHLHRVEGDLANASYWYNRARQPVCTQPLTQEWEAIAGALLARA